MKALGVKHEVAVDWFQHSQESPYIRVVIEADAASIWADTLGECVRRCFVSDKALAAAHSSGGANKATLIAAKLPDKGSTMAGDFGEILGFLYQAAHAGENIAVGPKKWRLKQDRTKPSPHSDLVQFVLPKWPVSSDQDEILCAEVKTKSTPKKKSNPFMEALTDSGKDRTSRLTKTLVWLKERSLFGEVEDITGPQLDRFLEPDKHPQSVRRFRAIVVICESITESELTKIPSNLDSDAVLVVISVPNLKDTYEAVFAAALTGAHH